VAHPKLLLLALAAVAIPAGIFSLAAAAGAWHQLDATPRPAAVASETPSASIVTPAEAAAPFEPSEAAPQPAEEDAAEMQPEAAGADEAAVAPPPPALQVPAPAPEDAAPRPAATPVPAPPPPPAAPIEAAPTATPPPPPPPPTATPRPPPTATPRPPPPAAPPPVLSAMDMEMFNGHNLERARAGLPPLALDALLVSVAQRRASDMLSRGYFSHTSPTGETAFTLLSAAGRVNVAAGENIARNNYPDAQAVSVALSGFMNSAGHRANILDPRFKYVGVASVIGADGMKYFAIIFSG
jgi:uncharacterized protein YkwD